MGDLIILKWNLKKDLHCWQNVFGCYTDIKSLQTLAFILYKSGICGSIQIISDASNMIEDWSKGSPRNSTELFNEEIKEGLGQ